MWKPTHRHFDQVILRQRINIVVACYRGKNCDFQVSEIINFWGFALTSAFQGILVVFDMFQTYHAFVVLSVCLSVCLFIYLSIYLFTCLPIYLSFYLSTYLSVCFIIGEPVRLFVYLHVLLN